MMEGAVLVKHSEYPLGRIAEAWEDYHGVGSAPPLRMGATLEPGPAVLIRNENSYPGGRKVKLSVT